MKKIPTIFAFCALASAGQLCAQSVSGTIYWAETVNGEHRIDDKTAYKYSSDGGQTYQYIDASQDVDWANSTVVYDSAWVADGINAFSGPSADFTIGKMVIAPTWHDSAGANKAALWMGGEGAGNPTFKVLGDIDVYSNVSGAVHAQNGLSVGGDINVFNTDAQTVGKQIEVSFGGGRSSDTRNGMSWIKVDGGLNITGDARFDFSSKMAVGTQSDASLANPAVEIKGAVEMQSYNGSAVPALNFFFRDFPEVGKTRTNYVSFGGLNGVGEIQSNSAYADPDDADYKNKISITLTNADNMRADFKGKIVNQTYVGHFTDGNFALDMHMNGGGVQVFRAEDGSKWRGQLNVNNGTFYLANSNNSTDMQVDVAVAADAAFGAVGLDSDIGTAYVKNLGIADEGMIMVYADGNSNSSIHIYEALTIGGTFDIFVDGAVSEGDALWDLFTWEAAFDEANRQQLVAAFEGGNVDLYVNGQVAEIDGYSFDGNSMSIDVGHIVPEPAAVAALMGGVYACLCRFPQAQVAFEDDM